MTQLDFGAALRDDAHALLEEHRADYVAQGRRAFLLHLLANGKSTVEVVRDVVKLPEGINPNLFGAIPGPLARKKIIERVGYVPSTRAERHASAMSLWDVVDRRKAHEWLGVVA